MHTEEEMLFMLKRHQDMVRTLAKPGYDIAQALMDCPEKAHDWHMVTGIAGEAGELLDAFKKYVIYGKELDRDNVVEELGDLVFYMQGIMNSHGITWQEVLSGNYDKLMKKRYKDGYSDQAAIDRADKS